MLPIRGKKKPAEMVKAPRSKGCRVCVQRRIKCDQTKPHCQRCQRANRDCPGFETTKFVDEGPTLKAFYEGPSKEQPNTSHSSSSSPQRGQNEDPSAGSSKMQENKPRRRSITPINAENWDSGDFERNAMINIICPTAYQSQLLSQFISAIRQPVQAPTFRCHSMWLRDVALCSHQSSCLTWAVRTISIAHLGHVTHDPNLIETSRRVYGRALLNLNAALQDPVEGLSSNTLSATMILSFYEILNCTDRNSWIKHAGGAGHLMRLRGPARHFSGTDRTMFIACRYSLIMESFQNRTACFLEAPEWRALGWKIHEDLKRENSSIYFLDTSEHFFQEIVTHPAFLRHAIDAVADPQPKTSDLQSLLAAGHAHRTNYQSIHARLTDELRAQGSGPTRTASKLNDTTFPVIYEYRDIQVASLFVGYWACLSAINICIIGLQAKLAGIERQQQQEQERFHSQQHSAQSDSRNTFSSRSSKATSTFSASSSTSRSQSQRGLQQRSQPLWEAATSYSADPSTNTHLYIAENAAYAREICKSVEHMQSTPFIGPLFLILALRMALRMAISRREKLWILDKLEAIGENLGIAKSEVEVYWSQRSEAEAYWNQRSEAEGNSKGKGTASAAEKPTGMSAYVEEGVRRRSVGKGVEMPAVGVVGFGELSEDVDEGGLDLAGPPVTETPSTDAWNRVAINPAILSGSAGDPMLTATATTSVAREEAGLHAGLGWREPVSLGYNNGNKGLVAEMAAVGTQGASEEFGTVGGLGVEWEDSIGLWRQDGEDGG